MTKRHSLPLILAVALTVVGCSSSDDTTDGVASLETTQTQPQTSEAEVDPDLDAETAMLDFTQCMRDKGVEIGDPTMSADGSMQLPPIEFTTSAEEDVEAAMAEMDALFAECNEHLEGIALAAPDPGAGVAFEDAFVEYAGCMRDQGIDMPDPDFSGAGGMIELGSSSPGDEAEFEAAHRECKDILAGAGIDF